MKRSSKFAVYFSLCFSLACGDDSSGDEKGEGGSDRDGANASDGGMLDPAEELARALQTDGIRIDDRRQRLVLEAWCKNEIMCGDRDASEVELCISERGGSFLFVAAGGERCLDATLDQMACYASGGCGQPACVEELLTQAFDACKDLFGSGAN